MCMRHLSKHAERKVFGGFNFIIVFWTLLSILRLSVLIREYPLTEVFNFDLLTVAIPLLFLAVLNVLLGVSLFFPQKKNHMWILSILIATVTLVTLNTFQVKLSDIESREDPNSVILEF